MGTGFEDQATWRLRTLEGAFGQIPGNAGGYGPLTSWEVAYAISLMAACSVSYGVSTRVVAGLVGLTGLGVVLLSLAGRRGDLMTPSMTTVVMLVAAHLISAHAWKWPLLRTSYRIVGAGGISANWWMLAFCFRFVGARSASPLGESSFKDGA